MEVRGITLAAGESYELRLTGRGARGYVWTWQVTGNADAVSVTEVPEVPEVPEGPRAAVVPDPSAAVPPGAPLVRTYAVRGRRPGGRARIRFAQIRPPYPQEAPYDEFVLDVEVTGAA
ncbi:protease inhibitor I42 family protein [Streptomyces sp. NPDC012794]|uniref:protease inhibitor I42 family protein n=1 Tax=Streptomyces sp. NPDC012794 TaxID=3364850 RepID=UPI003683C6B3